MAVCDVVTARVMSVCVSAEEEYSLSHTDGRTVPLSSLS